MKRLKLIIKFIFIFLVVLIFLSTRWSINTYGNLSVDELLFHLTVPIKGTESGLIINFIKNSLIPTVIISISLLVIIQYIYYVINQLRGIEIKIFCKKWYINLNTVILRRIFFFMLVFLGIASVYSCLEKLDILEYIKLQSKNSNFIEENYVDPKTVKITFPKEKKNLIYIFVESLETTYFGKEVGGAKDINLMPELTKLTLENINFSSNDNIGGALQVSGTSWTSAAMVSHTSGIPLKISSTITNDQNNQLSTFLKGAYSLGEILEKEDYNQMLMIGSDKEFGNRDVYFKQHGNYDIYDYATAVKNKKISSDYRVWWGYEDTKLFSYAKEEIKKLSKKDQPFNFTMLTANTHHIGGYLEDDCYKEHSDQFSNVISCTSKQLVDFINWIKAQSFYDDTTVIIVGDHLSMDPDYFQDLNNYQRTVYNLFINSSISTDKYKNRKFSTMDFFPTTLASMGVKIKGDKLALGTNLFSEQQTLIEKYGYNKVNRQLQLKSSFYNQKFIY